LIIKGYDIVLKANMILKQADNKGRILLGRSFAGSTMLAEHRDDGTIILHPAITVPTGEAWVWKNKRALAMVNDGIEEAARRKHALAPNLVAAAKLAAKIKD
jgi:hypothetical protein